MLAGLLTYRTSNRVCLLNSLTLNPMIGRSYILSKSCVADWIESSSQTTIWFSTSLQGR